ncbi:MAG: fructose-6-phosphate aldolase [Candidatus Altiarchaeum hamiconexum]|uniref:Probable transaldolase n=1 Tax=Candidatus Altarchaeum hamiconexum TaxID=1803513 RepID=A0A8J7YYI9_9ARCH|nr:fructose-6-phosphate aldolase [Candidatus Altarchaeum hamiconexum]OIQ06086.1 MAG: fructose-6-phosphate aldolase [Candidatus Altarchaeum sp. CG2_30_32_3053]PIN67070.1 MAG: fructose-6-phosphate aldolase [Candidatus Altarchaeum sp. CG12_big_fil_rev_8_21_14_0_65_33_22]PIV28098.1 MAG: fructose-6-phosphate aldolase [Candidatus Altarchaeum sp. CG03_land_8_20_14_0_80_32_618]PIX48690.1 MAG: fructose-6-phosphate aldolase [Candidatus Altarchaeum sp. CG_4_8_14_3_um_filter_33_2054]PIZ29926.1 MAG: fructo
MKIFLDTANIEQIKHSCELGIVDGVTTNPTLVAKEKGKFKDLSGLIGTICDIVKGPVSVEAISENADDIISEAEKFAEISKYVVIKVPMTRDGLKAVKILSRNKIKTNMTLIFSANQALLAAKAGANYASPFIGRLDDISHEGMQIIVDIREIFSNYAFNTEVIVASIRHPLHVLEAAKIGADIATIPFDVLDKMLKHPLTDIGIEKFKADFEKVKGEYKI